METPDRVGDHAWLVVLALTTAVLLAGCVADKNHAGEATYLPMTGTILEVSTTYTRKDRGSREEPRVQLAHGTAAVGLQLFLKIESNPSGQGWEGSPSCTEWLDRHRNIRTGAGVPRAEHYVVPSSDDVGRTGPESRAIYFPFDHRGKSAFFFPSLWTSASRFKDNIPDHYGT